VLPVGKTVEEEILKN